MIGQEEFLKKYNHSPDAFASTGLEWPALEAIHDDHASKRADLLATGNLVSEHLRQIPQVHSLKMRIKDPEHLIDKLIRKKLKEPEREITIENYETEVTDLVGVRALHLFKEDWLHIHAAIMSIWENKENPVASIRKGDQEELFKEHGLLVREHPAGYRSVHYTIKFQPTKKIHVVEIQVRTIFEEGWSEIDHGLRYPYEVDNAILCDYLGILNVFAGGADQMGSFIRRLKSHLADRDARYQSDIEIYERDKQEMIQNLESVKKQLNAESEDRKKLQKTIDSLQTTKPPTPAPDALAASGFSGISGWAATQKCEGCGGSYNSAIGVCPRCLTVTLGVRRCRECGSSLPVGGLGLAHSDLCFRCQTLGTSGAFPNACCRCGRIVTTRLGMINDGVCEVCKATSA